MIRSRTVLSVVTIVFLAFLGVVFVRSGAYSDAGRLMDYLSTNLDESGEPRFTTNVLETELVSRLWIKNQFIEINGALAKLLNMRGRYADMGMYVTKDNYIVSTAAYTTTDYEVEQILAFKKFLDENEIHMLYVNEPTKYVDDSLFAHEFGVESYSNRNMDVFLQRIREAGVPTLDLRENIKAENIEISDMFYRTDHHWTAKAALWAAQKISEGLNQYCGYEISTNIFDFDNYEVRVWEHCWLGEQGRKLSRAYVGLDDYMEIKPKYSTSFTFKTSDNDETECPFDGTFDSFIDESAYDIDADVYEGRSWHYSYSRQNCINKKVDFGKVLVLGDSYEEVMEPFLALGIHEVDSIDLRKDPEKYGENFNLFKLILDNKYDTVLICYAQFMLGAHDTGSSNALLFSFT